MRAFAWASSTSGARNSSVYQTPDCGRNVVLLMVRTPFVTSSEAPLPNRRQIETRSSCASQQAQCRGCRAPRTPGSATENGRRPIRPRGENLSSREQLDVQLNIQLD